MCGILVTSGVPGPFAHTHLKSLRARGPDAIGFWCDTDVNIAQTRLAIIGLGERGIEPIENETHVLAYNGEIYNFDEIRRRLERDGPALSGANDAEVLLHAWSRWGPEVLSHMVGFWAFVVYDKQARTLSLVRDQLGVKPLYYRQQGKAFCAASMLRTILETTDSLPRLDYEALSEYAAYQFTFGEKTFFDGVRRVLPGHIVTVELGSGRISDRCYEDIFSPPAETATPLTPEWVEQTRELVQSGILESTISDVPFTTLCSGGIDSSVVTRVAGPELAYHCNYSDPECNETFFAKQAVEDTGTRLFVVNASESFDLVERLSSIVEDFDDLTIGSVVLPLDELLGQVARRYKVFLTGTGGDELFGGYVRYQLALGECFQDSYKGLYESLRDIESVAERFQACHLKGRTDYFRFYDPGVESTFRKAYEACGGGTDHLRAMLTFDRRYFLSGLLNIDDKIGARHSLESRPSLLNQRLVRHVAALEPAALISELEPKSVFRDVVAPMLPRSITHRSDKMGFTTPIGTFVQGSSDRIRQQLADSPFRDLYNLHRISFANQDKFSRQVFGLLMIDLWLNRYAH